MDHSQEPGPHVPTRVSIPRLSKLPMPRSMASIDNLKISARSSTAPNIHQDDLRKTSHIPRPAGLTSPLGENFNHSIRSRYGWTDITQSARSPSPVRDALRDVQSSALDTTPPGRNPGGPRFEAGNENPMVVGSGAKDVNRSQIVSSPPSTTLDRPDSPSKRPFRPPGRISPTKEQATPPSVSPGEIYTPPKAFVKGQRSRIAKAQEPRRTASSVFDYQTKDSAGKPISKNSSQTMRIKTNYSDKTAKSHALSSKPSLASIFKEPQPATRPEGKVAPSSVDSTTALLKPRSRGENSLALSTPPKANSKAKRITEPKEDPAVAGVKDTQATTSPKSSAALRDTIAKAKAAKRKGRQSAGTADVTPAASEWLSSMMDDELPAGGDRKGLLRKRTQQATISGSLNIAAMNLKQLPVEVKKMYDPEYSTTNWAEMVQLTKLNAADNELEDLDEQLFPSNTEEEEETNRQFWGLETIDLHRNRLQRLPMGFATLERLQALNLSGNKLTGEAFEVIGMISSLKELFIAENTLEGTLNLDACRFEDLELLDIQGNAVSSFGPRGLATFEHLKTLNLAGNKFSSLDWFTMPTSTLTELNISKNRLSGALFTAGDVAFNELRILNASYNDIEEIATDDNTFPKLRSLSLSGNRLKTLPSLPGLQNLITWEIADNKVAEIPGEIALLEVLKSANFANNDIRVIPAEIASMEALTTLNLVGNPLQKKKYLTIGTAELKLDLEKKHDPTGQHGHESSATTHLPTSTSLHRYSPANGTLDLSSQSLSEIPLSEIDLSESIQFIKLSNNELSTFPTDLLCHPSVKYSLTSLDLSHNPFLHPTEYLATEVFLPNLKSMYIVSTGLTSLDGLTTCLRAPELREVNISCHRLAGHVPWVRAWWPKVTTLLATDNWFTSVDVEGVRGLEVLDIRNNEIDHLPPKIGMLGNLPEKKVSGRLRVLEVSGNRFRVPRIMVVERGTEAVLKDLRRMVRAEEVTEEWAGLA